MLVYIPGLNNFFLLISLPPVLASSGLWMIPTMLLYEETRKFLIRRNMNGWVAKLTLL
jgi:hypothetical protein